MAIPGISLKVETAACTLPFSMSDEFRFPVRGASLVPPTGGRATSRSSASRLSADAPCYQPVHHDPRASR